MYRKSMIHILRYKADHIKARIKPEFFSEVADFLEKEQRKGHWIPSHIPESILDECSECGFSCGAFTFNYCPNCGADMREVTE